MAPVRPRISLDLHRLAESYASGAETPVTVMQEVLRRIGAAGNDHVWISRRSDADILRDAHALLPEQSGLPLFGVPFAVKDNIDAAELETTAGCPAFAYRPAGSSPAVQRLRDAGAILIGKTNLDQFAAGLVGTRSPYGTPRNPFDPDRIPGGSSSGSAVAVASGQVSFALGTDTAGSGRVPAGFNNLVGLKPTRGLVSTRGVVPACRSLDCVSVFALTVADATRVMGVIAGFDEDDPFSRPPPPGFSVMATAPRTRFRFAIPRPDQRRFFGDTEAELLFDQAVDRARQLGGTPVQIDFAPWYECAGLLYAQWVAERTAGLDDFLKARPDALHPVTRRILDQGRSVTGVEVFQGQHRLAALARQIEPLWREVEFLLVPTTGTAWRLEEVAAEPLDRNSALGIYTNFTNLLDLSAIAVPSGFTVSGFPVGVTLIGPAWHDGVVAGYADAMQAAAALPLGATGERAPTRTPFPAPASWPRMDIAVFGAHLAGEPLNPALLDLGGVFRRPCLTAPCYRMVVLPGGIERPGLIRSASGKSLPGEIWSLPSQALGTFLASIAAPLGLGRLELEAGESCLGFICEALDTAALTDITDFGSWRAYKGR